MELIFCRGLLRRSSKQSPSIFDYTTTFSQTFTYFNLQKYHTTPFIIENLPEILQEMSLSPDSSEDISRFYLQVFRRSFEELTVMIYNLFFVCLLPIFLLLFIEVTHFIFSQKSLLLFYTQSLFWDIHHRHRLPTVFSITTCSSS